MYKAIFNIEGGKVDNGTNSPERNIYGTNNNLSKELALSVQKHNAAIRLWSKNAIVKDKLVAKIANINCQKDGIQKDEGFNRKNIMAMKIANGRRVNCSAKCEATYLHRG